MAETEERVVFETTEPVLGSFLNVTEAKRITKSPNEVARFSGNFEFLNTSADLARLRGLIVQTARAKWPALDVGAAIKSGELLTPLSDGDALADKATRKDPKKPREWSRGRKVLIARSKDEYPPTLVVRENGVAIALDNADAIKASGRRHFYTGQNVLFAVRLNAYDAVGATGKPGVNAYLEHVESVGGGEKLVGSRPDPVSRFSGYQGLETAEDPTGAKPASDTDW